MKNWREALVGPTTTIHDTIRKIDSAASQIAVIIDDDQKLLGTVTDGDVRRGILRGVPMTAPASEILNPDPITATPSDERSAILALMKQRLLRRVPIIDPDRRVIGIESIDELLAPKTRSNPVLLMAGGRGSRMQTLTSDLPKPMLEVGGRPILETILLNFIEYGFKSFYFSVNYRADVIREHFGDGSRWGVEIKYLEEKERLGTAGAIRLLPETPKIPMIVMNGDVLTRVNFDHLIDFHESHSSIATMCVREYSFQVPFGVLELDHHRIVSIREKPLHRSFVNAGIYVLEPEALKEIPNGYFDMPTLFENLLAQKKSPTAFPVREPWMDVGQPSDYERAKLEFSDS